MSWTKQQLVEEAFGELAMQGYVYSLDPDMMQTALRRLDMMMATWNGQGIRLGYPIPSSQSASKLTQDSNIPDIALEGVVLNLAVRLAAGFGKQLAATTQTSAKQCYDMLIARAAIPPEVQYPETMPRGAGNKPWRWQNSQFMPIPDDEITTGPENNTLDFN